MRRRQLNQMIIAAIVLPVMVLGFQNCGGGFAVGTLAGSNSTDTASGGGVGPDLDYQAKALSLISQNCAACHADQSLGNVTNILNMDHLIATKLVVAGEPSQSPLFTEVNEDRMPPGRKLSDADKNVLRNWILSLGGVKPVDPGVVDLSFSYQALVEPIPFRMRLGKLVYLTGSASAPSLTSLLNDRLFLGDYDYSRSITPKVSWEATDMKAWMEAVQPICTSNDIRTRFPWPSGASAFVQTTLGHAPTALENTIIQEINGQNIPATEKFDVFCLSILTSLEFITK